MKKVSLAIFISAIIILACNNNSPESRAVNTGSADTAQSNATMPLKTCYLGITGRDTTELSVNVNGNIVTGNLDYKRYEKDSNSGTIQGALKGDTLLANYTFNSEGSISVREVIFLIKDTIAMEGFGALVKKDQKMAFEDPSKIPFEKGQMMKKIDCVK